MGNMDNMENMDNTRGEENITAEETRPLTAKEKHEIKVQEWNETAKDPSLYETYETRESTVFPGIHMFAAKKRGRSHVMAKKPCQDDCMVAEGKRCVILVDADGVSACSRSEEGSRIACEVLIELVRSAEDHCSSEEEFVKLLQSGQFRDRLLASWLKKVISVIREGSEEWKDSVSEIEKFGTTILYAVITEHWYVAGNLGDGQILFFNEGVSVKLRYHTPKESSRVYCLVNPRCALDGFQTAAYPRTLFDGILLSTDGMYDFLEPADHFYRYGMELKDRFMKAGEPLQPFCYTEGDKPMRDFSQFRSMDDCSIVLAYDKSGCNDLLETSRKEIEKRQDVVRLQRLQGDTALFEAYRSPYLCAVCVSRSSAALPHTLSEAVVEA
ncbi:MAG: protein phosphatase 2C domain-containing protein, partial [Lachnospiraceae bacterium]|nr:protein phosphatase 2C domain-containing protein [Lachnospiraceae bacterium]